MKRLIVLFLTISWINGVFAQASLESRLDSLEQEIGRLIKKQLIQEKQHYDIVRENLVTGVELIDKLNTLYSYIIADIETQGLHVKMAMVNNPTSDLLGFKFSDILREKAIELFNSPAFKGLSASKRGKFFRVLDKITSSELYSTVQSVFPITGTVRSVITAAASLFSDPDLNVKLQKEGSKIIGATLDTLTSDNNLGKQFLNTYVSELTPYLLFYESLEYNNLQFNVALSELVKRYKNLPETARNLKKQFFIKLGLDSIKSSSINISSINQASGYNKSTHPSFDFTEFTMKQNVVEANNITKQMCLVSIDLESLYTEFVKIVRDKLNSDRASLEGARKLKGAKHTNIDAVRNDIIQYQKSPSIDKYQDAINSVSDLRSRIIY
jgi:hypothetical protein